MRILPHPSSSAFLLKHRQRILCNWQWLAIFAFKTSQGLSLGPFDPKNNALNILVMIPQMRQTKLIVVRNSFSVSQNNTNNSIIFTQLWSVPISLISATQNPEISGVQLSICINTKPRGKQKWRNEKDAMILLLISHQTLYVHEKHSSSFVGVLERRQSG